MSLKIQMTTTEFFKVKEVDQIRESMDRWNGARKIKHTALVGKIAQNVRMSEDDVNKVLKALHFAITDAIEKEGDMVYLKNIGAFKLQKRAGKIDHLTGKPRKTDDKLYISFKPAKGLKKW